MNSQPDRTKVIVFGIAGAIVFFFILVFAGIIPGLKPGNPSGGSQKAVVLNFWGIDDIKAFNATIQNYATLNKGVKIAYRQIDEKNYEAELINAMAAGQGPDILMFHNSWLPKHGNKINCTKAISPLQMDQLFPRAVTQDFVFADMTCALPLSLDSLALFYNEDIFNKNSIVLPPATWTDFKNIVSKLTQYSSASQISRSAAAIGGSEPSISSASDLLGLLMFQKGSEIYDRQSKKVFFGTGEGEALGFYTQFGIPGSQYYTWDKNLGNYLDAFSQGQTAMIFAYARQIKPIKEKNPFLVLKIIPAPQFDPENPINYASYWGLAVSGKSQRSDLAWNFISYLAGDPQNSLNYLKASNQPPALKTLINQYFSDPDLNVFARQALTAKSWYQADSAKSRQIFSGMIESVLSNKLTVPRAMEKAVAELNSI